MTLSQYLDALHGVIERPGSNLPAIALIAAAVTLVVLILCVALLLLVLPGKRGQKGSRRPDIVRPEEVGDEEEAEKAAARRKTGKRVRAVLVLLLVIAAFSAAYAGTSGDSYCASSCHRISLQSLTQANALHRGIPCVRCHETGLPLGVVADLTARVGHRVEAETGKRASYDVRAAYGRCGGCHRNVLERTLLDKNKRVRVSHKEPLAAGMTCDDCHKQPGHGSARAVSMTTCVRCHDGKQASAGCTSCHEGDVGYASEGNQRIYTQLDLPPVTCGGCHDEKKCDACHGLRMPHDQAFLDGGHARYAGFSKKQLCWRCHTKNDCGSCHGDFDQAHSGPAFWFAEHKKLPQDAACDTCHNKHRGPICRECH